MIDYDRYYFHNSSYKTDSFRSHSWLPIIMTYVCVGVVRNITRNKVISLLITAGDILIEFMQNALWPPVIRNPLHVCYCFEVWENMFIHHYLRGFAKKKFKKSEITMEMGGWV